MMRFKQIVWFTTGFILFSSLFLWQSNEIEMVTKNLINQARNLNLTSYWPNFQPASYPVDVYKQNLLKDTTLRYEENGWLELKDKSPIYALSMDRDPDGQAVLAVIDARNFRSLSDIGQFNGDSSNIYYQAMIIHEAFHCFQADQGFYDTFSEKISEYEQGQVLTIARELDNDLKYQSLWNQEMDALVTLGKEPQSMNLNIYQDHYQTRKNYIINKYGEDSAEAFLNYSSLYEKAEGTAQYMENIAISILRDEDLEINYSGFTKDTTKYYHSGFLKAYIIDKYQGSQWKEDFFIKENGFEDYIFTEKGEK